MLGLEIYTWAYLLASLNTVTAVIVTMLTITQHLLQTRQPQLRTYTIRVLLMVPIYAIEALMGLVLREWSEIFEVWRECYEAFTLFSFMQLMLSYLSIDAPMGKAGAIKVALDMRNNPQIIHPWPVTWFLEPWEMGPIFLRNTLLGVFQYCAVMLAVTFLSLMAWMFGIYDTDMAYSNWASAYPYLELMQSTSQCWALYCLVLFYQATKKKLGPIHPLNKFICIKMVVFFTFWQEVVIASLVRFKIIRSNQFEDMDDAYGAGGSNSATMHWSTTEIANGINDFIVCVEMLGFAIAHIYVFPPSDYIRAERMSVHVSVRDETSFNAVNLHDPYGKLNDLEDPETHVTEQRVHGGFQNHRMLEQLIQGVNFFDLINDVKTLHELDAHHRENEHLNGTGYKTFDC